MLFRSRVVRFPGRRFPCQNFEALDEYVGRLVVDVWGKDYQHLYRSGMLPVEYYTEQQPQQSAEESGESNQESSFIRELRPTSLEVHRIESTSREEEMVSIPRIGLKRNRSF